MSKSLKMAHVNVRSLMNKFYQVKDFILQENYDIFAISETWLSNEIADNLISIRGYNLFRKDRGSRGGGVCIYVKNSFKCCLIDSTNSIEQLWINFKVSEERIAIGVVYRPPNTNYKLFIDELEQSCTNSLSFCDKIYCFGDNNVNFFDESCPSTLYFKTMLESINLEQIIAEPTRFANGRGSLLDLILVSSGLDIIESGVQGQKFADHETVYCHIQINQPKVEPTIKTIRCFKNFDIEEFRRSLQLVPWQTVFHIPDIDGKVNFIQQNILNVINQHAPIKKVKITSNKNPPWLTDNLKLLMRLRDKAFSKYKKTKKLSHWDYYKSLRNTTNQAINREKKAYFASLHNTNTKNLWRELKSVNIACNSNVDLPPNLQNPNDINNFFINSISAASNNPQPIIQYYKQNPIKVGMEPLLFNTVDTTEIYKYICQIKSNSSGVDGITIQIIEYCCPTILPYLTHVMNYCVLHNIFPSTWKIGAVVPIAKIKDPKDYKDLRPITILPVLSKVFEKVIEKQIRAHLCRYHLFPENQSGFRPNHSCTTALLNVTDDLLRSHDQGKVSILTLLDFSKAFDTINHDILCAVLEHMGFSQSSVTLLKNYLAQRMQYVRLNNSNSQLMAVTKGVPQGSILGPLLFVIYTSTFHRNIKHCSMQTYADDTQIYYSFWLNDRIEAVKKINEDLHTISETSKNHSLVINPAKSVVLIFGNEHAVEVLKTTVNITIDNTALPIKNETRNLGLFLDNSFKYKTHISHCIKRAYAALKLIYPHRHYLSVSIKTMLCETLVLSQFTFCSQVYGSCISTDTARRIQRVQNSCMRLIYGVRKYDHISHKLLELGWLNMTNRRTLQSAALFLKIIKLETPKYLFSKVRFRNDIHNLNLRYKNEIDIPLHKTGLFKGAFSYQIAFIYNSLPDIWKNLSTSTLIVKLRNKLFESQNMRH